MTFMHYDPDDEISAPNVHVFMDLHFAFLPIDLQRCESWLDDCGDDVRPSAAISSLLVTIVAATKYPNLKKDRVVFLTRALGCNRFQTTIGEPRDWIP